ncbi:MAG: hypothetical protein ACXWWP_10000, partial [Candidatus Binatia bacterium]
MTEKENGKYMPRRQFFLRHTEDDRFQTRLAISQLLLCAAPVISVAELCPRWQNLLSPSVSHFLTALTFRKSIRAIELYSRPVNLGLSIVASAFQNSGAMAASVSVNNF